MFRDFSDIGATVGSFWNVGNVPQGHEFGCYCEVRTTCARRAFALLTGRELGQDVPVAFIAFWSLREPEECNPIAPFPRTARRSVNKLLPLDGTLALGSNGEQFNFNGFHVSNLVPEAHKSAKEMLPKQ
jgi:hypothetical protein